MTDNHHSLKTVVFDFGGVLIDWDPRFLYRKLFPDDPDRMERFLEDIQFYEWNRKQDAGRPFAQAIAELTARFPHYDYYIRAYDERYEESLTEPIWANVDTLVRLKAQGVTLHAISNWSMEKFRLVRDRYDFFNWFEVAIISGEAGLIKPDPRIYQHYLEMAGLEAGDCVVIDDSAENITTARQMGFATIHYRSPDQLKAELQGFDFPI